MDREPAQDLPALHARAYHEAAHAVVAHLLGLDALAVNLSEAYLSGRARLQEMRERSPTDDCPDEDAAEAHAGRLARVLLAGAVCDRRLGARVDPHGTDMHTALHIAIEAIGGLVGLQVIFDRLWADTDRILDRHWSAVEALAGYLLRERALDGAQVQAVLHDLLWNGRV